jgi:hypothetical protein
VSSDDRYDTDVFINCPFDQDYRGIFDAVAFAAMDCGLRPRCALEVDDSGQVRLDKIVELIRSCRFGVHDLSRTELDEEHRLPRFNMPFELGLFMAARRFGSGKQRRKVSLILDRDRFRYQKFLSDIAGQDIRDHGNDPHRAIGVVRDWLRSHAKDRPIPGGELIGRRYKEFLRELPRLCAPLGLNATALTFPDYTHLIETWLKGNP